MRSCPDNSYSLLYVDLEISKPKMNWDGLSAKWASLVKTFVAVIALPINKLGVYTGPGASVGG